MSESDIYRRQILTSKGDPRAVRVNVNTVDLVIVACLNFREFLILGLFTKFKIREFSFSFCSAIIIIIFGKFLNSRICPPREN